MSHAPEACGFDSGFIELFNTLYNWVEAPLGHTLDSYDIDIGVNSMKENPKHYKPFVSRILNADHKAVCGCSIR
jgi:hypothetical protein